MQLSSALGRFSHSLRSPITTGLYITLLLSLSSCKSSEKSEPTPPPAKPAAVVQKVKAPEKKAPAHAPAKAAAAKLGIEWDVPTDWKVDTRPRMMRAATYHTPGDENSAEVSVFYFGKGQGGDVEANMTRWVGQFKGVPEGGILRAEAEAGGLKRHTVTVSDGEFSSGMPGQAQGAQKNWGMEGAIIETPSGSYYFKMVGPAASVKEQAAAFKSLLDSIKLKS